MSIPDIPPTHMVLHVKKYILSLIIIPFLIGNALATEISLHGEWNYALDPGNQGIKEKWFSTKMTKTLVLPGSLQNQGIGDPVSPNTKWVGTIKKTKSVLSNPLYKKYATGGNIKIPSWLQPERYYRGIAWFQKEINLPASPSGEWLLELERPHWETTLYVDGVLIGTKNSLGTPHRYVIRNVSPGNHCLTIRVDNQINIPVGIDAHSVSDHTQSNWNGITGKITISPLSQARLENIRLTPEVEDRAVRIDASIKPHPTAKTHIIIEVLDKNNQRIGSPIKHELAPGSNIAHIQSRIVLGNSARLWDEHSPNLYQIRTTLLAGTEKNPKKTVFGLREFKAKGTRFTINGRPAFLRGTLECCSFPLTGYPPTDEKSWTAIFKQARNFGLNHIRFHSWCPPKAAFNAADELGMYLQVECGAWSTVVGDNEELNSWIREEGDRILEEYGNHPSFCLMAHGNEPSGKKHVSYLAELVDSWKKSDSRHLYSGAAGWPYLERADYWNAPAPRLHAWGAGLKSRINALQPSFDYDFRNLIKKNMPTISHEIGQWCAYPDFGEINKYTGALKAKNFEIFQEIMEDKGMSDLSGHFLFASGKLQALCYKAEIEASLRTPGMAGFQLLGLTDFPGQGTALVGVLNTFWEPKGYIDAAEYRTFCSDTVPLARLPRMIWNNNETFQSSLEISHFGQFPVKNALIEWKLLDGRQREVSSSSFTKNIPVGNAYTVGTISCSLKRISTPSKLRLEVTVTDKSSKNCIAHNFWNVWVYPERLRELDNKVYITHYLDDNAKKHLTAGGHVLLTLKKGTLAAKSGGNIAVGFSPIFWNTAWTNNQPPHTLGIYCDPRHPALALFPNDGYSDWQWWDIVRESHAIILDSLPKQYKPIIYYIDDWFLNRKIGLLMEMKVGQGKLLICGADLEKDLDKRPGTRQFRHSLLSYMASPGFSPTQSITIEELERLLPTVPDKL